MQRRPLGEVMGMALSQWIVARGAQGGFIRHSVIYRKSEVLIINEYVIKHRISNNKYNIINII